MKRKFALALALVMIFTSLVTMNVFASSYAYIYSNPARTYAANTLLPGSKSGLAGQTLLTAVTDEATADGKALTAAVPNEVPGLDLLIQFNTATLTSFSKSITVQLTGGEFAYLSGIGANNVATGVKNSFGPGLAVSGTQTKIKHNVFETPYSAFVAANVTNVKTAVLAIVDPADTGYADAAAFTTALKASVTTAVGTIAAMTELEKLIASKLVDTTAAQALITAAAYPLASGASAVAITALVGSVQALYDTDAEVVAYADSVVASIPVHLRNYAGSAYVNYASSIMTSVGFNAPVPYTFRVWDTDPTKATITFNSTIEENRSYIALPLSVRATGTADIKLSVTESTNISGFTAFSDLIVGGYAKGATLVVKEQKVAKATMTLGDLIFTEKKPAVFGATTTIILDAPEGYKFINTSSITAVGDNQITTTVVTPALNAVKEGWTAAGAVDTTNFLNNEANTSVKLTVALSNTSTSSSSSIVFKNVQVTPIDDETIPLDYVLNIKARSSAFDAIDAQVGTRKLWNYTTALATGTKEGFSGFIDASKTNVIGAVHTEIALNKVTVKEVITNTWGTSRDYSYYRLTDAEGNLLDKVHFSKVTVTFADFVGATQPLGVADAKFGKGKEGDSVLRFNSNGSEFRVSDLPQSVASKLASMAVTASITAEAGFAGDVYVTFTNGNESTAPLKVATFKAPITVETKVTSVQIGHQSYPVASIRVAETAKTALRVGTTLVLGITEYKTAQSISGMYFAPIVSSDITVEGSELKLMKPTYGGSAIGITIDKETKNAPGAFTINNLILNVNRTIPEGDYQVLVFGNAVVNNNVMDTYLDVAAASENDNEYYGFVKEGYSVDYLKVATEGAFTQVMPEIKLTDGSNIALINGVATTMAAPAKIVDGRFYVPIKFVSMYLGVPENKIIYDDLFARVTIKAGASTILFTKDSYVYTVDSIDYNMFDDGVYAAPYNDAELMRMYVPLKYVAKAFNIQFTWDAAASVATFNPVQ